MFVRNYKNKPVSSLWLTGLFYLNTIMFKMKEQDIINGVTI